MMMTEFQIPCVSCDMYVVTDFLPVEGDFLYCARCDVRLLGLWQTAIDTKALVYEPEPWSRDYFVVPR